ncbi:uncharacterized protein LOC104866588 isoform X2 [Fukomys damarensis]|uniref:uncharacterized protein LOC104866588 isoform X2 n=1 Tax=Fukomys damarensis TaxID=885580 RepID=UPI001455008D|nr:uncharacterized protein LOC104866588 isoform X2 [Fukomys damarensis]
MKHSRRATPGQQSSDRYKHTWRFFASNFHRRYCSLKAIQGHSLQHWSRKACVRSLSHPAGARHLLPALRLEACQPHSLLSRAQVCAGLFWRKEEWRLKTERDTAELPELHAGPLPTPLLRLHDGHRKGHDWAGRTCHLPSVDSLLCCTAPG